MQCCVVHEASRSHCHEQVAWVASHCSSSNKREDVVSTAAHRWTDENLRIHLATCFIFVRRNSENSKELLIQVLSGSTAP